MAVGTHAERADIGGGTAEKIEVPKRVRAWVPKRLISIHIYKDLYNIRVFIDYIHIDRFLIVYVCMSDDSEKSDRCFRPDPFFAPIYIVFEGNTKTSSFLPFFPK